LSFASFEFLAFAAAVIALYGVLPTRGQNALLLLASYVFYGCWDWRFLGLIALSTAVDYVCARAMEARPERAARRPFLLVSLTTNLGLLGVFKYADFFAASAARGLAALGLPASSVTLDIVLPVGISFYTFQTLGYAIDVYRGRQRAERDPLLFALYVAYFPQLVAGPIERAGRLLPQLRGPRRPDADQIRRGLGLVLMGFFKKLVIADAAAPYVDALFADPGAHAGVDLWIGVQLFALQIYADFSGYSDIARGVSALLGIELCVNFRQPYLSANVSEFWRRWHVSLSQWLRDYLYIPLGGSRRGDARTRWNLLATMLLGGLWHGASWKFVAWGGLHGAYLAMLATFQLVAWTWIPFRAASFGDAASMVRGLSGGWGWPQPELALVLAGLTAAVLWVDLPAWRHDRELPWSGASPAWRRGLAYAAMFAAVSFVGESVAPRFIYFQF